VIYIQAKICFYLLQKTIFSSISLILQSAKWGYFIWNEIYVQWNTSSSSFLEMNFGTISKFQKLKQNLQNILFLSKKKTLKKFTAVCLKQIKHFLKFWFFYIVYRKIWLDFTGCETRFAHPNKNREIGVLFQL